MCEEDFLQEAEEKLGELISLYEQFDTIGSEASELYEESESLRVKADSISEEAMVIYSQYSEAYEELASFVDEHDDFDFDLPRRKYLEESIIENLHGT